jgi:protein-disulfide isomerase
MQLDVDEGIRLGVTVTPAFFIYGQLIVGSSFQSHSQLPTSLGQISHKMITIVKSIMC